LVFVNRKYLLSSFVATTELLSCSAELFCSATQGRGGSQGGETKGIPLLRDPNPYPPEGEQLAEGGHVLKKIKEKFLNLFFRFYRAAFLIR
jgi:hypothetical protein